MINIGSISIVGTEDGPCRTETCLPLIKGNIKRNLSIMSFGNLLHPLPQSLKNSYREYEKCKKKLIGLKWSIEFNRTCLNENILPKYTYFKSYDPAVTQTKKTLEYRRYLVQREIQKKEEEILRADTAALSARKAIDDFPIDQEVKVPINEAVNSILDNFDHVTKTRTVKKLNTLYYGRFNVNVINDVCVKTESKSYINLSDYELSQDERAFLDLGLNCHLQPKYDKLHKQVEIEMLYQSLLKLEQNKSISVKPELVDQLKNESTKHRNTKLPSILTPALRRAAQNLRNNQDIIIRKADKSPVYVVLNKHDYINKINNILADTSKFKSITRDPSNTLKQKANRIIDRVNSVIDDIKLNKIIGDYEAGYIYGNVKTHKIGNPLRPIISQIPTPTYNLAKTINNIISPYIPKNYLLQSTNDFIDLLHSSPCQGSIASLDVESLFTNVPIDETIDIILNYSYNHPSIKPPKIPPTLLKQLLEICTKEAPFKSPEGKLFVQVEGVAMGSPLGPTFANFYMGQVEHRVFESTKIKPNIYARYVDDIFVQVLETDHLVELQNLFQLHSVLNFTIEYNIRNKLPFLDVLVDTGDKQFKTTVYRKPTNSGHCLNYKSECTEQYKKSVITSYLNRAYKITSTWESFHHEISHIRQTLINNNYSNTLVDAHINKFISSKVLGDNKPKANKVINIFYQNQTHGQYKTDERIIKDIVYKNTKCIENDQVLKIIFFYKNRKTHNLVMKNNLSPPLPKLQQKTLYTNLNALCRTVRRKRI